MKTFPLLIITPSGKIFSGQINSLTAPGAEGLFGILADHAPFITSLAKGILTIKSPEQSSTFVIDSGILEVNLNKEVLILADHALEFHTKEEGEKIMDELAAAKSVKI